MFAQHLYETATGLKKLGKQGEADSLQARALKYFNMHTLLD